MEKDTGRLPRPINAAIEQVQRIGSSVMRTIATRELAEHLMERDENQLITRAHANREVAVQLDNHDVVLHQTRIIAFIQASSLDRRLQSEDSLIGDEKFMMFLETMNELPAGERNFKSLGLDDDQIERMSIYPILNQWFIKGDYDPID